MFRVFARFEEQTLVAEVLQRNHLISDFFLRELLADNVLVLRVIRTVGAGVDAVVRKIKGREEHDARAVDLFLHIAGDAEDFFVQILLVAEKERCRLAMREALGGLCLFKERLQKRTVGLMLLRPPEGVFNFFPADEFIRAA